MIFYKKIVTVLHIDVCVCVCVCVYTYTHMNTYIHILLDILEVTAVLLLDVLLRQSYS